MADDQPLTPEQIFIIERYAEALNTLATAIGQLVADEVITPVEGRVVLFRLGVLTEQDMKAIEAQK
jgi:hypothetical protein